MYNNIYHIGGYTGKLSWNLGKKWGADACSLKLPKEENDDDDFKVRCEAFWTHLEAAANSIISSGSNNNGNANANGNCYQLKRYDYESEEAALASLGKGTIMDAGQGAARDKRIKKAEKAKKEGKELPAAAGGGPVSVGRVAIVTADDDNDNDNEDTTFALALLHGANLVLLSRLGAPNKKIASAGA